jgi:hypothetical protein
VHVVVSYYLALRKVMGLDPGDVIELDDDDLGAGHVAAGLLERIEEVPCPPAGSSPSRR